MNAVAADVSRRWSFGAKKLAPTDVGGYRVRDFVAGPAGPRRNGLAFLAGTGDSPAMKKPVLLLVLSLFTLCGCAHQYVMKLSNGTQLTTANKPQLKGGFYYYKDAQGRERREPQSRVRVIEPASLAKEEQPRFKPGPAP